MRKNLLKEKLAQGKRISGCLIHVPSPALVEVLALSGFDYVFIDCEHSTISAYDCENMVRAAELYGITPLARIRANDQEMMIRYLDCGVQGLIVPGVSNRAEAEFAVGGLKYYPLGMRGVTAGRAADYGLGAPLPQYIEYANEQTILFTSMENAEAVENVEDIMAVEGLDGILFGANDLSQSLGVPGQVNHPLVKEAIEKARTAALKTGKVFGSVVRAGETPEDYFSKGYGIVQTNVFSLLAKAGREFVAQCEEPS